MVIITFQLKSCVDSVASDQNHFYRCRSLGSILARGNTYLWIELMVHARTYGILILNLMAKWMIGPFFWICLIQYTSWASTMHIFVMWRCTAYNDMPVLIVSQPYAWQGVSMLLIMALSRSSRPQWPILRLAEYMIYSRYTEHAFSIIWWIEISYLVH